MRSRVVSLLVVSLGLTVASVAGATWPPSPYIGGVKLPGLGGPPSAISDGAGGTFVAGCSSTVGARVQHLDANGVALWPAGGVAAGSSGASANPNNCALALDGAGGVVVAFHTANNRVSAQRLDANGNPLWGAAGVALLSVNSLVPVAIYACPDGAGGAYVSWGRDRFLAGEEVVNGFVSHLNGSGTLVSSSGTLPSPPALIADGSGGAIYTWAGPGSGGDYDCFAQHVSITGTLLWGPAIVCNQPGDQTNPVLASDGAGGAIFAWLDMREYVAPDYSIDIFADRINASGTPLWFFAGLPVCRQPWIRENLAIAPDGLGGATIVWDDARDRVNFDIYAQHATASGFMMLAPDGMALCTASGDKTFPTVASDGGGGSYVAWHDLREGTNGNIYGCGINAAGSQIGLANGFPIALAEGEQADAALVSDGKGAAFCAWTDVRPGDPSVRVQRIDPLGFLGDPAPLITSIRDVPNDQGGHVKVTWNASNLDTILPPPMSLNDPIGDYQLYRLTPPSTWQLLVTVPSGPFAEYSAVVATPADSTAGNPANVTYRVNTRFGSSPDTYHWYSAPDSGHSVDNLAPLMPSAFSVASSSDGARLGWNPGLERDLDGYRLYRLASANETPGAANLLASVHGDSYVDVESPACVYELFAVDRHGNLSPPASFAVTEGRPLVVAGTLELAAPSPDPAREAVLVSFTLPAAARVKLEVFDVSGRRMRTLASDDQTPGVHQVRWDLRDVSGGRVSPGVFQLRLMVAGEVRTRRLAVVR